MIEKLLIVKPFSPMFIALFVLGFLFLWLITKVLRDAKDSVKQATFIIICLITAVCFFIYKYALSKDAEYNVVYAPYGGFNWWQELPLNLCNIHMLLIPVAVATKKRQLLSFCFYVAPLGALMALLMPVLGFSGYSVFLPRIIGFYGTHIMVIVEAIALYTLDFYKPEYKDILSATFITFIISLFVFGINLILEFFKLCPNPNYFFLMNTEGNPILELFKSYIPYRYLYALPCGLILMVWSLIVTFFVKRIPKKRFR